LDGGVVSPHYRTQFKRAGARRRSHQEWLVEKEAAEQADIQEMWSQAEKEIEMEDAGEMNAQSEHERYIEEKLARCSLSLARALSPPPTVCHGSDTSTFRSIMFSSLLFYWRRNTEGEDGGGTVGTALTMNSVTTLMTSHNAKGEDGGGKANVARSNLGTISADSRRFLSTIFWRGCAKPFD
jgi:hypothetical protein